MELYREQFCALLSHENPLLHKALQHLLQRSGKLMRPTLVLLSARMAGEVNQKVLDTALSLELLHTASLVHDDVVDESDRRRGQSSLNALFGSKASVLVGDYILSRSLQCAAQTQSNEVFSLMSQMGQALADGELLQMHTTTSEEFGEQVYLEIVRKKTASLFAACAQLGALMAGGDVGIVERMRQFGQLLGTCFQLRDDIFDYDSTHDVGKPCGNDMKEGKLTLPALYALHRSDSQEMKNLALRVRACEAGKDEIARLVAFAKEQGGIEYACWMMDEFRMMASGLLDVEGADPNVVSALHQYVDFAARREV